MPSTPPPPPSLGPSSAALDELTLRNLPSYLTPAARRALATTEDVLLAALSAGKLLRVGDVRGPARGRLEKWLADFSAETIDVLASSSEHFLSEAGASLGEFLASSEDARDLCVDQTALPTVENEQQEEQPTAASISSSPGWLTACMQARDQAESLIVVLGLMALRIQDDALADSAAHWEQELRRQAQSIDETALALAPLLGDLATHQLDTDPWWKRAAALQVGHWWMSLVLRRSLQTRSGQERAATVTESRTDSSPLSRRSAVVLRLPPRTLPVRPLAQAAHSGQEAPPPVSGKGAVSSVQGPLRFEVAPLDDPDHQADFSLSLWLDDESELALDGDAVQVLDERGNPLVPIKYSPRPRRWWGLFRGEGRFQIKVAGHDARIEFEIERKGLVMCLCDEEFQSANRRGLLLKALERAQLPCPTRLCTSPVFVSWLSDFALRFPMSRDLRGKTEYKRLVYEWFLRAREDIPQAVECLWRPDGEIGVTRFCTVQRGTNQGKLYTLRVRDDGKSQVDIEADDTFREALHWARHSVCGWLRSHPASTRVLNASVTIDQTGDSFEDGSVAFAALVAFFSLALRLPVRPDIVFSGIPGAHELELKPPAGETLRHKLDVVRQHKEGLIAPPGTARLLTLHEFGDVLQELNWQGALCKALGRSNFNELEFEVRHHSGASTTAEARGLEEVLQDAVYACLLAAGREGLSALALEEGVSQMRHADDRLAQFSSSILGELQQLERHGLVTAIQKRWRLHGPKRPLHSERFLRLAHEALAVTGERRGDRRASVRHRLMLGEHGLVAESLPLLLGTPISTDPEAPQPAPQVTPLLEASQQNHEFAGSLQMALSQCTAPSRHLWLVVLRCYRLPEPFASLAAQWPLCRSLVDRLFWLQACVETALHLLVDLALDSLPADRSESLGGLLDDFARRPSLGLMHKLVSAILAEESAPASGHSWGDEQANRWNKLLHHRGAWRELTSRGSELEAKTDEHAQGALVLLDRLHHHGVLDRLDSKARPLALESSSEEPSHQRPVGSSADSRTLFHRGQWQGQLRYWSFSSLACALRDPTSPTRPLQTYDPDTRLKSGLLTLQQRNPPLDRLPTPLASLLLELKQARSPVLRLAAIDEATHWLLLLSVPKKSDAVQGARQGGWKQLRTKRSLLDAVRFNQGDSAHLGEYVRSSPGSELAEELVGVLERLEHAPGPLSAWGDWIELATRLLAELVTLSPWKSVPLLLGREDITLRFQGLTPRPSSVRVPLGAWLGEADQSPLEARGWFKEVLSSPPRLVFEPLK